MCHRHRNSRYFFKTAEQMFVIEIDACVESRVPNHKKHILHNRDETLSYICTILFHDSITFKKKCGRKLIDYMSDGSILFKLFLYFKS